MNRDAMAPRLRRIAGFRNLLVHGYAKVDAHVVAAVATNDVTDLIALVDAVRGWLPPAA